MGWRYLQDLGDAFLSQVKGSQRGGEGIWITVVGGEVVGWFKWIKLSHLESNNESVVKISYNYNIPVDIYYIFYIYDTYIISILLYYIYILHYET